MLIFRHYMLFNLIYCILFKNIHISVLYRIIFEQFPMNKQMIQPFIKYYHCHVIVNRSPYLIYLRMNIYFACQLANALQYLTQLNLIHCDVAARNCLFYSDYTVKLTDCAMALPQYEQEYWSAINGQRIPLRWIAPEALTVRGKNFRF